MGKSFLAFVLSVLGVIVRVKQQPHGSGNEYLYLQGSEGTGAERRTVHKGYLGRADQAAKQGQGWLGKQDDAENRAALEGWFEKNGVEFTQENQQAFRRYFEKNHPEVIAGRPFQHLAPTTEFVTAAWNKLGHAERERLLESWGSNGESSALAGQAFAQLPTELREAALRRARSWAVPPSKEDAPARRASAAAAAGAEAPLAPPAASKKPKDAAEKVVDFPQDLEKLTPEQREEYIDRLAAKGIPALRKWQDLVRAQQRSAFQQYEAASPHDAATRERLTRGKGNLDIMDNLLAEAVGRSADRQQERKASKQAKPAAAAEKKVVFPPDLHRLNAEQREAYIDILAGKGLPKLHQWQAILQQQLAENEREATSTKDAKRQNELSALKSNLNMMDDFLHHAVERRTARDDPAAWTKKGEVMQDQDGKPVIIDPAVAKAFAKERSDALAALGDIGKTAQQPEVTPELHALHATMTDASRAADQAKAAYYAAPSGEKRDALMPVWEEAIYKFDIARTAFENRIRAEEDAARNKTAPHATPGGGMTDAPVQPREGIPATQRDADLAAARALRERVEEENANAVAWAWQPPGVEAEDEKFLSLAQRIRDSASKETGLHLHEVNDALARKLVHEGRVTVPKMPASGRAVDEGLHEFDQAERSWNAFQHVGGRQFGELSAVEQEAYIQARRLTALPNPMVALAEQERAAARAAGDGEAADYGSAFDAYMENPTPENKERMERARGAFKETRAETARAMKLADKLAAQGMTSKFDQETTAAQLTGEVVAPGWKVHQGKEWGLTGERGEMWFLRDQTNRKAFRERAPRDGDRGFATKEEATGALREAGAPTSRALEKAPVAARSIPDQAPASGASATAPAVETPEARARRMGSLGLRHTEYGGKTWELVGEDEKLGPLWKEVLKSGKLSKLTHRLNSGETFRNEAMARTVAPKHVQEVHAAGFKDEDEARTAIRMAAKPREQFYAEKAALEKERDAAREAQAQLSIKGREFPDDSSPEAQIVFAQYKEQSERERRASAALEAYHNPFGGALGGLADAHAIHTERAAKLSQATREQLQAHVTVAPARTEDEAVSREVTGELNRLHERVSNEPGSVLAVAAAYARSRGDKNSLRILRAAEKDGANFGLHGDFTPIQYSDEYLPTDAARELKNELVASGEYAHVSLQYAGGRKTAKVIVQRFDAPDSDTLKAFHEARNRARAASSAKLTEQNALIDAQQAFDAAYASESSENHKNLAGIAAALTARGVPTTVEELDAETGVSYRLGGKASLKDAAHVISSGSLKDARDLVGKNWFKDYKDRLHDTLKEANPDAERLVRDDIEEAIGTSTLKSVAANPKAREYLVRMLTPIAQKRAEQARAHDARRALDSLEDWRTTVIQHDLELAEQHAATWRKNADRALALDPTDEGAIKLKQMADEVVGRAIRQDAQWAEARSRLIEQTKTDGYGDGRVVEYPNKLTVPTEVASEARAFAVESWANHQNKHPTVSQDGTLKGWEQAKGGGLVDPEHVMVIFPADADLSKYTWPKDDALSPASVTGASTAEGHALRAIMRGENGATVSIDAGRLAHALSLAPKGTKASVFISQREQPVVIKYATGERAVIAPLLSQDEDEAATQPAAKRALNALTNRGAKVGSVETEAERITRETATADDARYAKARETQKLADETLGDLWPDNPKGDSKGTRYVLYQAGARALPDFLRVDNKYLENDEYHALIRGAAVIKTDDGTRLKVDRINGYVISGYRDDGKPGAVDVRNTPVNVLAKWKDTPKPDLPIISVNEEMFDPKLATDADLTKQEQRIMNRSRVLGDLGLTSYGSPESEKRSKLLDAISKEKNNRFTAGQKARAEAALEEGKAQFASVLAHLKEHPEDAEKFVTLAPAFPPGTSARYISGPITMKSAMTPEQRAEYDAAIKAAKATAVKENRVPLPEAIISGLQFDREHYDPKEGEMWTLMATRSQGMTDVLTPEGVRVRLNDAQVEALQEARRRLSAERHAKGPKYATKTGESPFPQDKPTAPEPAASVAPPPVAEKFYKRGSLVYEVISDGPGGVKLRQLGTKSDVNTTHAVLKQRYAPATQAEVQAASTPLTTTKVAPKPTQAASGDRIVLGVPVKSTTEPGVFDFRPSETGPRYLLQYDQESRQWLARVTKEGGRSSPVMRFPTVEQAVRFAKDFQDKFVLRDFKAQYDSMPGALPADSWADNEIMYNRYFDHTDAVRKAKSPEDPVVQQAYAELAMAWENLRQTKPRVGWEFKDGVKLADEFPGPGVPTAREYHDAVHQHAKLAVKEKADRAARAAERMRERGLVTVEEAAAIMTPSVRIERDGNIAKVAGVDFRSHMGTEAKSTASAVMAYVLERAKPQDSPLKEAGKVIPAYKASEVQELAREREAEVEKVLVMLEADPSLAEKVPNGYSSSSKVRIDGGSATTELSDGQWARLYYQVIVTPDGKRTPITASENTKLTRAIMNAREKALQHSVLVLREQLEASPEGKQVLDTLKTATTKGAFTAAKKQLGESQAALALIKPYEAAFTRTYAIKGIVSGTRPVKKGLTIGAALGYDESSPNDVKTVDRKGMERVFADRAYVMMWGPKEQVARGPVKMDGLKPARVTNIRLGENGEPSNVEITTVDGQVTHVPIGYFMSLVKSVPAGEKVQLMTREDYPIAVDYPNGDRVVIAPHIVTDTSVAPGKEHYGEALGSPEALAALQRPFEEPAGSGPATSDKRTPPPDEGAAADAQSAGVRHTPSASSAAPASEAATAAAPVAAAGADAPRELSFAAYLRENNIPDPGADHGILSPSGSISSRARDAIMERREGEWAAYGAAQDTYRQLVNEGRIVDPTGRVKRTIEEPKPNPERVALQRQAQNLREMAGRGMKPRAYRKKADELEAQAAALPETIGGAAPAAAVPAAARDWRAELTKAETLAATKAPADKNGTPIDISHEADGVLAFRAAKTAEHIRTTEAALADGADYDDGVIPQLAEAKRLNALAVEELKQRGRTLPEGADLTQPGEPGKTGTYEAWLASEMKAGRGTEKASPRAPPALSMEELVSRLEAGRKDPNLANRIAALEEASRSFDAVRLSAAPGSERREKAERAYTLANAALSEARSQQRRQQKEDAEEAQRVEVARMADEIVARHKGNSPEEGERSIQNLSISVNERLLAHWQAEAERGTPGASEKAREAFVKLSASREALKRWLTQSRALAPITPAGSFKTPEATLLGVGISLSKETLVSTRGGETTVVYVAHGVPENFPREPLRALGGQGHGGNWTFKQDPTQVFLDGIRATPPERIAPPAPSRIDANTPEGEARARVRALTEGMSAPEAYDFLQSLSAKYEGEAAHAIRHSQRYPKNADAAKKAAQAKLDSKAAMEERYEALARFQARAQAHEIASTQMAAVMVDDALATSREQDTPLKRVGVLESAITALTEIGKGLIQQFNALPDSARKGGRTSTTMGSVSDEAAPLDQRIRAIRTARNTLRTRLQESVDALSNEDRVQYAITHPQQATSGAPKSTKLAPGEKRPERASQYLKGEFGVPAYQLLEPAFIQMSHDMHHKRVEDNIAGWKKHIAKLPEGKQKREAEASLATNERQLALVQNGEWLRNNETSLRTKYVALVKEAVSKGEPVPLEVIRQHPEFKLSLDARERYEKGRHTSFANKSAAIDSSMQAERGYKTKRQDGKAITPAQNAEIAEGVSEIEAVMGPLAQKLRRADVTISHTSGKYPFLDGEAGGLYITNEKTVTIGVKGQPTLAHELGGHWLDFEAGEAIGAKNMVAPRGGNGKRAELSSLAVDDVKRNNEHASLILEAERTMRTTEGVDHLLKKPKEELSESERFQVEFARVHLGKPGYWTSPHEVWARLTEQYVSEELRGKEGKLQSAEVDYSDKPAYWDRETFERFKPRIKQEIQRRLDLIDQAAKLRDPKNKEPAPPVPAAKPLPEYRASTAADRDAFFGTPEVSERVARDWRDGDDEVTTHMTPDGDIRAAGASYRVFQQTDQLGHKHFFIVENGRVLARLENAGRADAALVVDPEHRGKQLGTTLLAYAYDKTPRDQWQPPWLVTPGGQKTLERAWNNLHPGTEESKPSAGHQQAAVQAAERPPVTTKKPLSNDIQSVAIRAIKRTGLDASTSKGRSGGYGYTSGFYTTVINGNLYLGFRDVGKKTYAGVPEPTRSSLLKKDREAIPTAIEALKAEGFTVEPQSDGTYLLKRAAPSQPETPTSTPTPAPAPTAEAAPSANLPSVGSEWKSKTTNHVLRVIEVRPPDAKHDQTRIVYEYTTKVGAGSRTTRDTIPLTTFLYHNEPASPPQQASAASARLAKLRAEDKDLKGAAYDENHAEAGGIAWALGEDANEKPTQEEALARLASVQFTINAMEDGSTDATFLNLEKARRAGLERVLGIQGPEALKQVMAKLNATREAKEDNDEPAAVTASAPAPKWKRGTWVKDARGRVARVIRSDEKGEYVRVKYEGEKHSVLVAKPSFTLTDSPNADGQPIDFGGRLYVPQKLTREETEEVRKALDASFQTLFYGIGGGQTAQPGDEHYGEKAKYERAYRIITKGAIADYDYDASVIKDSWDIITLADELARDDEGINNEVLDRAIAKVFPRKDSNAATPSAPGTPAASQPASYARHNPKRVFSLKPNERDALARGLDLYLAAQTNAGDNPELMERGLPAKVKRVYTRFIRGDALHDDECREVLDGANGVAADAWYGNPHHKADWEAWSSLLPKLRDQIKNGTPAPTTPTPRPVPEAPKSGLTMDDISKVQAGTKKVKLATLAEFINENFPELQAKTRDGHASTAGTKAGRIYTRPPRTVDGTLLLVWKRGDKEPYGARDPSALFSHNSAETYRTNSEVAQWVRMYSDYRQLHAKLEPTIKPGATLDIHYVTDQNERYDEGTRYARISVNGQDVTRDLERVRSGIKNSFNGYSSNNEAVRLLTSIVGDDLNALARDYAENIETTFGLPKGSLKVRVTQDEKLRAAAPPKPKTKLPVQAALVPADASAPENVTPGGVNIYTPFRSDWKEHARSMAVAIIQHARAQPKTTETEEAVRTAMRAVDLAKNGDDKGVWVVLHTAASQADVDVSDW